MTPSILEGKDRHVNSDRMDPTIVLEMKVVWRPGESDVERNIEHKPCNRPFGFAGSINGDIRIGLPPSPYGCSPFRGQRRPDR